MNIPLNATITALSNLGQTSTTTGIGSQACFLITLPPPNYVYISYPIPQTIRDFIDTLAFSHHCVYNYTYLLCRIISF